MRIGIFFGGPSREREISFAGGRTVYDNLDKSIFTPIPIFIDGQRRMILLDWAYIYKGTIRDFYPPPPFLPPSPHHFQIYSESLTGLTSEARQQMGQAVGRPIGIEELTTLIDMAFLALHGEYGEDGQIQGLLDSLQIPYTGSGIRGASIGMDKAFQKRWMQAAGFSTPPMLVIKRESWKNEVLNQARRMAYLSSLYGEATKACGLPLVVRPANQGSSIGVSIVQEENGLDAFDPAVQAAFFCRKVTAAEWQCKGPEGRVEWVRELSDLRSGTGLPLRLIQDGNVQIAHLHHTEDVLDALNQHLGPGGLESVWLEGDQLEQQVVIEGFLSGKEFSCIVVRTTDGEAMALPPTEIVKGGEVFDYRSKYLPGLSRKETPISLPNEQVEAIRRECVRLFKTLGFDTYARIDGFISEEGHIVLNDPNTTSGMLPSSFFFHQAAEIGLTPTQFLTFILRTSLWERHRQQLVASHYGTLLAQMDRRIGEARREAGQRVKVAVLLGGYSYERHISLESGRNVFEKLAGSEKYEPVPVFLTHDESGTHELFQLPANLMLKDNADDILHHIRSGTSRQLLEDIRREASAITATYASEGVIFTPRILTYDDLAKQFDGVFIALHGRPGEDGTVQQELEARGIPYNGSPPESAAVTIHKYRTLRRLAGEGLPVTGQELLPAEEFFKDPEGFLLHIEQRFQYPFIAKPVDDGCSSAVMVIRSRDKLRAYLQALFRESEFLSEKLRNMLGISLREEFPQKKEVLLEDLITARGADRFLEITGGFLTHYETDGSLRYEMFEPSEALAGGEVLTLEEKFLAGEGQNITPARFSDNPERQHKYSLQVRSALERTARLLGVEGYARIDAFVRIDEHAGEAETIVVEVNSLPGMTPATAIFHQAALNGYKPYDFVDHILEFGRQRQARKADSQKYSASSQGS